MSKWADYGISAVRFNTAHTHIDRVRVHLDNGETFNAPTEHSRQDVINAIKKGTTFVTITKGSEGKWQKGQAVYIIPINGTEFIKTTNNSKASDNLDNLPEF